MRCSAPSGWNLVALAASALGCAAPSGPPVGRWIGDAAAAGGPERIEVVVDSSGTAQVSLRSWRLREAPMAQAGEAGGDSVAFASPGDSLRLAGSIEGGRWTGELSRGAERVAITLLRLAALDAPAREGLVGTYRADDGRLLGVGPFSEFGPDLMVVDYDTGEIAPLYPLSPDAMMRGPALLSPVLAPDSVVAERDEAGQVRGLTISRERHPAMWVTRIATRDTSAQFANGEVMLAGTLTLPEGAGPHPALVLVHGSNAQTRDAMGPWVRFFAGRGFAVLSYDKRGTGGSTGDWKQADFEALAGDAAAAVDFLAARPEIRRDQIGLWGISQAGWLLPMVAAAQPDRVAFLIVHAGTGTTVREQGVLNLAYELRASGLPERSVAVGIEYQNLSDALTRTGKGWEALQQFHTAHRDAEPWLPEPDPPEAWFRSYYRLLIDFDPAPYWRQVRCPVLLFFGGLDVNVPPKESWPPIERGLREAGNTNVTQVVLPRGNHVLLEARTGAGSEYPGLTRFTAGYFDRMTEWLGATVRR
ncbi:MAG TPA: alpha/beta fold hydrolase [Gemmatimonadales bacterium]